MYVVEFLILSSTLDHRDAYESVRINYILLLVSKFYPQDFIDHENGTSTLRA